MNDRMSEIEAAGTDIAASNRLAEIRASMGGELESGTGAGAAAGRELEQGASAEEGDITATTPAGEDGATGQDSAEK